MLMNAARPGARQFAIAAAVAVLWLFVAGHLQVPVLAQGASAETGADAPIRGITVVAEGEARGSPDVAFVDLGVQTEAPTAREAMAQNAAAMAAVIEAIRRVGVPEEDLRTMGINLTPIRPRPRPGEEAPPPIAGYRATNRVHVTVEQVGRTGEVIDMAVQAGANLAGGVGFGLQDAAALRRQALEAAAQAARAQAEALAGALGLRITGVHSVVEEGFGGPPLGRVGVGGGPPEDVAPPIQPGELTVRGQMRVVYTIA
jgi:uncharacterized protein YggE